MLLHLGSWWWVPLIVPGTHYCVGNYRGAEVGSSMWLTGWTGRATFTPDLLWDGGGIWGRSTGCGRSGLFRSVRCLLACFVDALWETRCDEPEVRCGWLVVTPLAVVSFSVVFRPSLLLDGELAGDSWIQLHQDPSSVGVFLCLSDAATSCHR